MLVSGIYRKKRTPEEIYKKYADSKGLIKTKVLEKENYTKDEARDEGLVLFEDYYKDRKGKYNER